MAGARVSLKRNGLLLAWVSAGLGLGAFFLPWLVTSVSGDSALVAADLRKLEKKLGHVELTVRRQGKVQSGSLSDLLAEFPANLSGFDIPRFANQKDASVAFTLAGMLRLAPDGLDRKSWITYAVPACLAMVALFLAARPHRRGAALSAAVLCAAVAWMGCLKLQTFEFSSLSVTVHFGIGLWVSVAAYALMAIAALLLTATPHR